MLVHFLLRGGRVSGHALIGSGVVLWVTNVLLFGVWFWQLDGGGPVAALQRKPHPDFLFPQMTDDARSFAAAAGSRRCWTTCNVAAPTPRRSARPTRCRLTSMAKALMAGQALVALTTIGLVFARAVNIL